jgi:Na+/proline symporter
VGYSLAVGFGARKAASKDLAGFFLAGRRIKGWQAGFSMAATQFAADTPLLVTGLVATGGIFLLWQLWVYGIAFLLLGFLFSAGWKRTGIVTDAEFVELRYSGRGKLLLRVVKALYYGTVINCVVMAFVLVAAVRIAEVFLPWHEWLPHALYRTLQQIVAALGMDLSSGAGGLEPLVATTNGVISIMLMLAFIGLYSTSGGLRGVILTDTVQFAIALAGTALYALAVLDEVGGLQALLDRLVTLYGHDGAERMLSFLPSSQEALAPLLVIIALQWLFQMNSDGTGYLAQRAMACRSDRDARIAAIIFAWAQIVLRSLIWIVIAVGLLAIYPFAPEAASGDDAFKAAREATFVLGIEDHLGPGARGLMLTGLLAALASTIDTHLNWGASYWCNDIYNRLVNQSLLGRTPKPRELVAVARVSNLLLIAVALAVMTQLGSIQEGWKLSLLFGAGVGSVLVLRWVWERINLYSELAAMLVSLVGGVVLLQAFPAPGDEWLRLAAMAAMSTLAAVGITFITPPTSREARVAFYRAVRPVGFWTRTAAAAGASGQAPVRRLGRTLVTTAASAASLFLVLVGLGKLLLGLDARALWVGVGLLALAALLTPLWWRDMLRLDGDRPPASSPSHR